MTAGRNGNDHSSSHLSTRKALTCRGDQSVSVNCSYHGAHHAKTMIIRSFSIRKALTYRLDARLLVSSSRPCNENDHSFSHLSIRKALTRLEGQSPLFKPTVQ